MVAGRRAGEALLLPTTPGRAGRHPTTRAHPLLPLLVLAGRQEAQRVLCMVAPLSAHPRGGPKGGVVVVVLAARS